jgi:hypothetical protein
MTNPPIICWSPVITEARVEPESESLENVDTVLKPELDAPPDFLLPPPAVLVVAVAQAWLDASELPAELNARTV